MIITTTTTNNVHLQSLADTKAERFSAFQKAPFPPHATWPLIQKAVCIHITHPARTWWIQLLRNVGDSCLSVTCNTKLWPNNPTYGWERCQVTSGGLWALKIRDPSTM